MSDTTKDTTITSTRPLVEALRECVAAMDAALSDAGEMSVAEISLYARNRLRDTAAKARAALGE